MDETLPAAGRPPPDRVSATHDGVVTWSGWGDGDVDTLTARLEAHLQAEVDELCGPRNSVGTSTFRRASVVTKSVTVGGHRMRIRVQRMLGRDGKTTLPPTYRELRRLEREQRDRKVIGSVEEGVPVSAVSRLQRRLAPGAPTSSFSSTRNSARWVKFSRRQLNDLNLRPLNPIQLAVVQLDSVEVGGRTILAGLAITTDGTKFPLGIEEDQSENAKMVARMLRRVAARGADLNNVLWVLDGSDELRRGIARAGYERAQVQSCIAHVRRNVRKHYPSKLAFDGVAARLDGAGTGRRRTRMLTRLRTLSRELKAAGSPEASKVLDEWLDQTAARTRGAGGLPAQQAKVTPELRDALRARVPRDLWSGVGVQLGRVWNEPDHDRARALLDAVKQRIGRDLAPATAKAVNAQLDETSTLSKLGIEDPGLWKAARTTNLIEGLVNRPIRAMTRRHHTFWRDPPDDMRRRWVAATITTAAQGWNPVEGVQGLQRLPLAVRALRGTAPDLTTHVRVRQEEQMAPATPEQQEPTPPAAAATVERVVIFGQEHADQLARELLRSGSHVTWMGDPDVLTPFDAEPGAEVSAKELANTISGLRASDGRRVRQRGSVAVRLRGDRAASQGADAEPARKRGLVQLRGSHEASAELDAAWRAADPETRERIKERLLDSTKLAVQSFANSDKTAFAAAVRVGGKPDEPRLRVDWIAIGADRGGRVLSACEPKRLDSEAVRQAERAAAAPLAEVVSIPAPRQPPPREQLPTGQQQPLRDSLMEHRSLLGDQVIAQLHQAAQRERVASGLGDLSEDELRESLPERHPLDELARTRPRTEAEVAEWWQRNGEAVRTTTAVEAELIGQAQARHERVAQQEVTRRRVAFADPLAAIRKDRGDDFANKVARHATVVASGLGADQTDQIQRWTGEAREAIQNAGGVAKADFKTLAEATAYQFHRNGVNEELAREQGTERAAQPAAELELAR